MEIEIKSMEDSVAGTRIVAIIHYPIEGTSGNWEEIKRLHLGEAELTQKEVKEK